MRAKKAFMDQSFYERKMRLRQASKSLITSFWSKLHFDGEKHDAVPKLGRGSRNRYLQVFSKNFYRDFHSKIPSTIFSGPAHHRKWPAIRPRDRDETL